MVAWFPPPDEHAAGPPASYSSRGRAEAEMEPSAVSTLPPAVANGSSSRDTYAAAAAGVWAGAVGCHRTGAVRTRYYWPAGSHGR